MKKPTIAQIAGISGVSPATVSRFLNGSAGVSEATRKKIFAAVKNSGLTVLKRRQANPGRIIGILLLCNDRKYACYTIVSKFFAVIDKLSSSWSLLLLPQSTMPRELLSRFLHGELHGLLIIGHSAESELFPVLDKIPHVWLNSYHTDNHDVILLGNEFAGHMAARHFLESVSENTQYYCLTVNGENPALKARTDGFRYELFVRKIECIPLEVDTTGTAAADIIENDALENMIEESIREVIFFPADALFIPEDRFTALFYRICSKLNRTLPRIVSCNHSPEYLTGLYPRPNSIDLAPDITAEHALEELFRRIAGKPPVAENIAAIAQPQFIEGERK